MPKLIDLTGKKFGRLTVVDRASNSEKGDTRWNCVCDCGETVVVRSRNLRQGLTKSCGCIRKNPRPNRVKHGMSKTRLYRIWSLMKDRCENVKSHAYNRYGGKGVKVCDEWHSPSNFFEWSLANGYREGLTLDRIEGNGDYCPENCRWVDWVTQGNNTSRNRIFTIDGRTQTLSQWCMEYEQPYKTVHARINRHGWDIEKALKTPVRHGGGIKR